MSNEYVPLPSGESVRVDELFAQARSNQLGEGFELQSDGCLRLPDGSVVDENGVRILPGGNVLLPTDEWGFVDIVDMSRINEAFADFSKHRIDASQFWEIADAEAARDSRLLEDLKLFEESVPRPWKG